ncbi:MAG: hypothetical protein ABH857_01875 [Elusimicrobiota bacterium]
MIIKIALIASIILPLWNIPLVYRIYKRKSADDISMFWVIGVWVCLVFMFPSGLVSTDIVWKTFNIANLSLFSCVTAVTLYYRFRKKIITKK